MRDLCKLSGCGEFALEHSSEWRWLAVLTGLRGVWYIALYMWVRSIPLSSEHFLVMRTVFGGPKFYIGGIDDVLLPVVGMATFLWFGRRNRASFLMPWFLVLLDLVITISSFHGDPLERILLLHSMGRPFRHVLQVSEGSCMRLTFLTLPLFFYWAAVLPLSMRLFTGRSPWEESPVNESHKA